MYFETENFVVEAYLVLSRWQLYLSWFLVSHMFAPVRIIISYGDLLFFIASAHCDIVTLTKVSFLDLCTSPNFPQKCSVHWRVFFLVVQWYKLIWVIYQLISILKLITAAIDILIDGKDGFRFWDGTVIDCTHNWYILTWSIIICSGYTGFDYQTCRSLLLFGKV